MAAPDVRPRPRYTTDAIDFEPPYPPGWLDRLLDWIARAPGPNAIYWLGLLAVEAIYVTVMIWWNGRLPVGEVEPRRLFIVVVAP